MKRALTNTVRSPKICEIEMLRTSVVRVEEPSCGVDDMVVVQGVTTARSTYDEVVSESI
jgi:hypothetical protein